MQREDVTKYAIQNARHVGGIVKINAQFVMKMLLYGQLAPLPANVGAILALNTMKIN